MANSNFVVHNGLTVGPLTIDATTGNLTSTGSLVANIVSPPGGATLATQADATALAIALGG